MDGSLICRFHRSIKVHCYFDDFGMVAWAVKYKGQWYGASGEYGLLQYAERLIDDLKSDKKIKAWRWQP